MTVNDDTVAERAVEIMTLASHQEYDFLRGFLQAYDAEELRQLIVVLAAMTAGALDGAYAQTGVPQDEWLPRLCRRLLSNHRAES